jgi:MFS family permease
VDQRARLAIIDSQLVAGHLVSLPTRADRSPADSREGRYGPAGYFERVTRAPEPDSAASVFSAASGPAGRRSALSSLRHRDFRLFWLGALVSNIGTWMQAITVPYVIFQLTHSGAWVGLAAFVGLFPGVLLGPVAGALADRVARRPLLLASQIAQAGLALALWAVWEAGVRSPGALITIVAANGFVFGGTIPAWQAFVASLVPREDLLNAVTLNSGQFNAARAIGPAIGGLTLGAFGPSWAFLLNALSFVAVIAALTAMTARHPAVAPRGEGEGGLLSAFGEGVRYTWRHPGILLAIGLVGVVSFVASPMFQLLPIVAKRVFAVGPGWYGLLTGAFGAGAVVGAVVVSVIGGRRRRSQTILAAVVVFAVGLLGLGAAPVYALAVGAVLVMGVGFLASVAVLNTTVQLLVAERLRGRVLAVWATVLTGLLPLGALLQGWLSDAIGIRIVAVLDGLILLATVGVMALRPGLARLLDDHTHRSLPVMALVAPEPLAG